MKTDYAPVHQGGDAGVGAARPHQSGESARLSIPEIARRLEIGRLAVYDMLEQGIIPGIRLGRRWIVTRHAYEVWERSCGIRAGLPPGPEVSVVN